MQLDLTFLYDLLMRVFDLTNFLYQLMFETIQVSENLSFQLWHAVLGIGGGLILTFLILRFVKLFVPAA